MDFAPRDVQPPIREPNMPEKQDRKQDEKKDQEDRKPVIKTLRNDEPTYKYQWGVRVPDLNPDPADVERSQNYVVAHKWGVNVSKSKEPEKTHPIDATPKSTTSQSNIQSAVETSIKKIGAAETVSQPNHSEIEKMTSTASTLGRPEVNIVQSQSAEPVSQIFQSKSENLPSTSSTLESPRTSPSSVSASDGKIASRSPQPAAASGVDLTSGTIVPGDDDYNVPKEIPHGSEISAWRDVVVRSKLHEDELARAAAIDLPGDPAESIFIRPEPPQPKLDVRVVGAASDVVSPHENVAKPSELGSNTPAINFATTKKFHTCTIACRRLPRACRRIMLADFSSTSSDDGEDLRSSSADSEEAEKTEALVKVCFSYNRPGQPDPKRKVSVVRHYI